MPGEYYTPRAVTQFMVDQVDPKLGESILDPACGTGGFLACAIENIRKTVKTIEDEELPPVLDPRGREEADAAPALRHEHDAARHRCPDPDQA